MHDSLWIPPAAAAKSPQSCPTLCDPIDGSPPASPVPGILQARTLEWVAISFSNAWKWKVKMKVESLSHVRLFVTPWTAAHQAPPPLGFSRQEHWSGLPFPSPMHESGKWKWKGSSSVRSDSSPPHGLQPTRLLCPWDFQQEISSNFQYSNKNTGVSCHSPLQSSQPRDWACVSSISRRILYHWVTWEASTEYATHIFLLSQATAKFYSRASELEWISRGLSECRSTNEMTW